MIICRRKASGHWLMPSNERVLRRKARATRHAKSGGDADEFRVFERTFFVIAAYRYHHSLAN
jgi:hypothetical protein